MKIYIPVAVIILLICLFFSCLNDKTKRCSSAVQSPKSYVELSEILDTISEKYKEGYVRLGYIEFPFTLYENLMFRDILNNPCEYKHFLMTVLKDTNKANVQKLIALYGLQHLCIDDYLEVVSTVFLEYRKKTVDENFLMSAVSQGGFSLEVCKNYSNNQLKAVLKNIMATLTLDSNRRAINDIIDGRSWEKLHKYFKESGEPKPWECN